MYTPNDHLGAAHQRLLNATSDEVNADAPASPNVLARHYLPPLPSDFAFAPLAHVSPHDASGFTNHVNDAGHVLGTWDQISHHPASQHAQHRLPTPPLRNDGLCGLPRLFRPNFSYAQQGLPSSADDILPHTRAYLASGPNIIDTGNSTIWNTEGTGSDQDDLAVDDQSDQSHHNLHVQPWDRPHLLERQPQLEYAATHQPVYAPPSAKQQVPPFEHYQSRRASSIASSPVLVHHYGQHFQMPAVQQWRTDNLAGPAPVHGVKSKPDAATRRKQEVYRQKGEARRHTIAAGMPEVQTRTYTPLPTPGPRRVKATAPAKRRKLAPAATTIPEPLSTTGHMLTSESFVEPAFDVIPVSTQPPAPECEIPPPLPTADDLPQPIVSRYEAYKWSVYHYELQPSSQFDYAESWLHVLLHGALHSSYQQRHHSHVSRGFIKDGTPRSLLVLHNATNPFSHSPAPDSTVSIGVYGYHWCRHDAIHWTTLAADLRALFAQCLAAGILAQKHAWPAAAPKPSDRRFHRAYWLAANRRHLRDLLNRGPSDDRSGDLIENGSEEDPDTEFCIRREDLTNKWDVTGARAEAAWRDVQDEVAGLGDAWEVSGGGWQHVVVSNSEW